LAHTNKPHQVGPIYCFAITWLILSLILPLYRLWGLILVLAVSCLAAYAFKNSAKKKKHVFTVNTAAQDEAPKAQAEAPKISYGPEIDPILAEGNKALAEMGRLYMSINDTGVKAKINELMRITDKITQDAIADPSDIPQIKKFLNYYLPTTIKLLNAYDRMSSQGIEGDNLNKSMANINKMLDETIVAFQKWLDSLFANQALDIETDIAVMNQMLEREGFSGGKDFDISAAQSK